MKRVLSLLAFLALSVPTAACAEWSLVRGSGNAASFESTARPTDVLMREDQRAARPEQVREVWHFVCSRAEGDSWKLDGIQQLA